MVEQANSPDIQKKWPKTLLTSPVRGFCVGVESAINEYKGFQNEYGEAKKSDPSIGRLVSVGEPAHNQDVISQFGDMTFVKKMKEVEKGDWAVEGPHGTSEGDLKIAEEIGVLLRPTECHLVTVPKKRVWENTKLGIPTIYFGEVGHEEARAVTESQDAIIVENKEEALELAAMLKQDYPNKPFAFANQTTKNADEAIEIMEELKRLYPDAELPRKEDICYATRDRQISVKELVNQGAEAVIVVGSPTSSNANRLYEIAGEKVPAYLVGNVADFDIEQLRGYETIAVHSSASTPEPSFQKMLDRFREHGTVVQEIEVRDKNGKIIDESKKKAFAPRQTYDFRK